MRKLSLGFLTRSDTNRAVRTQKMVKRLEISDLGSRGIVLHVSMKQKQRR